MFILCVGAISFTIFLTFTPRGGGYSWEFLVGMCCPVLQILSPISHQKCHYSHPFSDLASKKQCHHYLDQNSNKKDFFVTSHEALRIVYFDFNGQAAISWEENYKKWHLILRKKWTPRFKFHQSVSFQPKKAALLECSRILKFSYFVCRGHSSCTSRSSSLSLRTFSPPPLQKTKQNKNISMEQQGDILCFLQRFDNNENKNETSSNPGYRKEFSGG